MVALLDDALRAMIAPLKLVAAVTNLPGFSASPPMTELRQMLVATLSAAGVGSLAEARVGLAVPEQFCRYKRAYPRSRRARRHEYGRVQMITKITLPS
jgi:hypothetical protein